MAEGSWIRRMFEEGATLKQRYGEENVFDLSLGNPIMEPPVRFKQELKKLAENPIAGMHRYMENAGYPETRAAVATQLSQEFGIRYSIRGKRSLSLLLILENILTILIIIVV